MSYLVDNTGVSNLFEYMVSTTSLCEIHLCKLILSLSHKLVCSMEDNLLLVDMFLIVMFISLLTPSHSSCLYIQGTSSVYSSHIQLSNHLISIIILIIKLRFSFDHRQSLLCYLLSFLILVLNYCLRKILTWYQSYTKFLQKLGGLYFVTQNGACGLRAQHTRRPISIMLIEIMIYPQIHKTIIHPWLTLMPNNREE